VDPDTRPSVISPPFTGHFRITADTPRGLQPFLPSVSPANALTSPTVSVNGTATTAVNAKPASESASIDPNLALRKDVYTAPTEAKLLIGESTIEKKQFTCFTCGVDCTRSRYHSLKTPNFEVCPNCYVEGRFPSTMYSGDFIKLEATPKPSETEWTDQETLLLLEGIEMFDEDWNAISDHVGSKSREQCILHFLKLPIEDPYVGTKMSELGPLQYHQIPFSDAENPIMSLVAFLASVVNPGVAAAAAKEALKELSGSQIDFNQPSHLKLTEEPTNSLTTTDVESKENSHDKNNNNSNIDQTQKTKNTRPSPIQAAAVTAIAASAAKAKSLADYEEREMRNLVNQIVELQIKKVETKLKHFEEMETFLENEKKDLEVQREQLVRDRLQLKNGILSLKTMAGKVSSSNAPSSAGTPVDQETSSVQQKDFFESLMNASDPFSLSPNGTTSYQKDPNAIITSLP